MPSEDKGWVDFSRFIQKIEQEICAKLLDEKGRFPSVDKLVNRFRESSRRLLAEGPERRFRKLQEDHNELCVAFEILKDKGCLKLEYEPSFSTCAKRIDFKKTLAEGVVIFLDVKTINPNPQNDWPKYEDAVARGRIPPKKLLNIDKKWLGGEFYHALISGRSKMLDYAVEVEEKITSCARDIGSAPVVLVFCTNELKLNITDFENFADFYRTGCHRYDDHFSEMDAHHISEKSISLTRQISRFACFRRGSLDIKPRTVCWDVRGAQIEILQ